MIQSHQLNTSACEITKDMSGEGVKSSDTTENINRNPIVVSALSFPSIMSDEQRNEELWQSSVSHPLDVAEHDVR